MQVKSYPYGSLIPLPLFTCELENPLGAPRAERGIVHNTAPLTPFNHFCPPLQIPPSHRYCFSAELAFFRGQRGRIRDQCQDLPRFAKTRRCLEPRPC